MAVLSAPPALQFFDSDGNPLAGGFVYTYAAGTTTPKATFTSQAGTTENTNPVVLDAAGRPEPNGSIWINGSYKFVVEDALGNTISTTDNVTAFTATAEAAEAYFESFSGDGSQTAFTLSTDFGTDEKALMVFVDAGAGKGYEIQAPSAYTLSGTSLTFASAPASGTNNIQVWAPSTQVGAAAASAEAADNSATAAATSETNAATSETNAATSASNAATSEANALAAAADANFQAVTTAGTAGAYTADFDPDLALAAGARFILLPHVNNSAFPTLAADGGAAKDIIRHTTGGPVAANELVVGYPYLFSYNATLDKFVAHDLHTDKLLLNLNANGKQISSVGSLTVTGSSTLADVDAADLRLLGGTVVVDKTLDEDDMASDSATALATQQSIKAYVNNSAATDKISGLEVANNSTDADHDLDIATGQTWDDTLSFPMRLTSATTKRLDATFAEGTGNGGFATGESLPTSGTFHLWLITKTDGTTDVFANNHATSGLSPTLPTGFTYKKRILSFITDSSANILGFSQNGNCVSLNNIIQVYNAAPGTTSINTPAFTPLGIVTRADFIGRALNSDTSLTAFVYTPGKTNEQPNFRIAATGSGTTSISVSANPTVVIPITGNVALYSNEATTNINLFLNSWTDLTLGR